MRRRLESSDTVFQQNLFAKVRPNQFFFKEGDFDAHVRAETQRRLIEKDLCLDRILRERCARQNSRNLPGKNLAGLRIESDLHRLPDAQAGNVALVHVHPYLQLRGVAD
jgi:hypothetical protein